MSLAGAAWGAGTAGARRDPRRAALPARSRCRRVVDTHAHLDSCDAPAGGARRRGRRGRRGAGDHDRDRPRVERARREPGRGAPRGLGGGRRPPARRRRAGASATRPGSPSSPRTRAWSRSASAAWTTTATARPATPRPAPSPRRSGSPATRACPWWSTPGTPSDDTLDLLAARGRRRTRWCSTASACPGHGGEVAERGYYTSFAGQLTYPKADGPAGRGARAARRAASWSRPTRPTWPRCPVAAGPTARPTSPTPCASWPGSAGRRPRPSMPSPPPTPAASSGPGSGPARLGVDAGAGRARRAAGHGPRPALPARREPRRPRRARGRPGPGGRRARGRGGPGVLTVALARAAGRVHAVEVDRPAAAGASRTRWRATTTSASTGATPCACALGALDPAPTRLVANLPYADRHARSSLETLWGLPARGALGGHGAARGGRPLAGAARRPGSTGSPRCSSQLAAEARRRAPWAARCSRPGRGSTRRW